MSIKSDKWIEHHAKEHGLIVPYVERQVRSEFRERPESARDEKVVSYGPSSYGYDLRLARGIKLFTEVYGAIVDPKNFDPKTTIDLDDEAPLLPPHSFALGYTIERLKLPRRTTGLILGKSTYARCGIILNFTPAEAGWEGHLTVEISNTTPNPARIYTGEGIAQILFFESDEECATSYADRAGKYQNQGPEVAYPRV